MLRTTIFCFGPSILSSIALILSIFANSRCNLLLFDYYNGSISSIWTNLLPFAPSSLGLWCFETTSGANIDLRDYSFDDKFDAARALGVATLCLGWMIVLFYLFAGCFRFSPHVFRFVGMMAICASLFQGLVFLVFKSVLCAGGCSLDTGGKCAISAVVMWFLTGITSCGSAEKAADNDNVVDNNHSRKPDES